jgi:hypothetical protein
MTLYTGWGINPSGDGENPTYERPFTEEEFNNSCLKKNMMKDTSYKEYLEAYNEENDT